MQNSNESFNATVRTLAPKSYASGKKIIDIATDIAVCNFNDGFKSIMEIIKVLNLAVSPIVVIFMRKRRCGALK